MLINGTREYVLGSKLTNKPLNLIQFAIVVNRFNNRSLGYGFVLFAKADDALRAREELNGVTMCVSLRPKPRTVGGREGVQGEDRGFAARARAIIRRTYGAYPCCPPTKAARGTCESSRGRSVTGL